MSDMGLEREKYLRQYCGRRYGYVNWGRRCVSYLRRLKPASLCDVGCGQGKFCIEVSKFIPKVYGVDIASVAAGKTMPHDGVVYIDSDAGSAFLGDKSVEWITSFDCLEHCPEDEIDRVLSNFRRIASVGAIFSIAYVSCTELGDDLHLTVKPESWWVNKIDGYGKVELFGRVPRVKTKYIKVLF